MVCTLFHIRRLNRLILFFIWRNNLLNAEQPSSSYGPVREILYVYASTEEIKLPTSTSSWLVAAFGYFHWMVRPEPTPISASTGRSNDCTCAPLSSTVYPDIAVRSSQRR